MLHESTINRVPAFIFFASDRNGPRASRIEKFQPLYLASGPIVLVQVLRRMRRRLSPVDLEALPWNPCRYWGYSLQRATERCRLLPLKTTATIRLGGKLSSGAARCACYWKSCAYNPQ